MELASVDLGRNPHVDTEVFDLVESLPSWVKPAAARKPMERLRSLAALLAADGIVQSPTAAANTALCQLLDGFAGAHKTSVAEHREHLTTVGIEIEDYDARGEQVSTERLEVATHSKNLDDIWTAARKELPQGLADEYLRWTLGLVTDPEKDVTDEDIGEAQLQVAAIATLPALGQERPSVAAQVDAKAEKIITGWFAKARPHYRTYTASRQAEYEDIRVSAGQPTEGRLVVPEKASTASQKYDKIKEEAVDLGTAPLHLLSGPDGLYPLNLGEWEIKAVEAELDSGAEIAGWYRNPSHAGAASLRVAWRKGSKWGSMQPDLIFVVRTSEGKLVANIVDPHSAHLADAVPKLQGLAEFAERFGDQFGRIDAVGENSNKELQAIDLQDIEVREAVKAYTGSNVTPMYDDHGHPYPS